MKLPQGICPRCGEKYYGWVLVSLRHQVCSKCGTVLEVTEGGYPRFRGPYRLYHYLKDNRVGNKRGK